MPKDSRFDVSQFERWQSPEVMYDLFRVASDLWGDELLTSSGTEPQAIQNAFMIAVAGMGIRAKEVRLVPERDRFPDAQMRLNGKVIDCELTESHTPGRRRSDEFKFSPPTSMTEMDELTLRQVAEDVAPALNRGIQKKASKNYSASVGLVVYLNHQSLGFREPTTTNELVAAMLACGDKFNPLIVLWGERVFYRNIGSTEVAIAPWRRTL